MDKRLEFGDKPYMTREETSKYTDLLRDGKARMFTWVMEAKSVVLASPEKPITKDSTNKRISLVWKRKNKK